MPSQQTNARRSRMPSGKGPVKMLSSKSNNMTKPIIVNTINKSNSNINVNKPNYMSIAKKSMEPKQEIQLSRHNPNKIIIGTDRKKNNEALELHKKYNNYSSNNDMYYNDAYYEEREQSIVEEMRLKLTQDEFEDWYAHHLEYSDNEHDDNSSYSSSDYYYN